MTGASKTVSTEKKTTVALVKTSDRSSGIKRAIHILGVNPVKGKDVLLKEIELLTEDEDSKEYAERLAGILLKG